LVLKFNTIFAPILTDKEMTNTKLTQLETTFYWNEDTIEYFKVESINQSKEETIEKIKLFVELECYLEDGENAQDLINDLIKKISI
jgi:NAD+--asparagine ADP-ribosyltransferase